MCKKTILALYKRIKWLLRKEDLADSSSAQGNESVTNDFWDTVCSNPSSNTPDSLKIDTLSNTANDILCRVQTIEKYLALEGVAEQVKSIDYSFVKDKEIRAVLESDHIEMWRCRLGLRTKKQEFNEFCLYVQMQVENLLRYYYNKRFNYDQDKLYDHFRYKKDSEKNLFIAYSSLLWKFDNEFGNKNKISTDILDAVRELRNGIIHCGKTAELSSKFVAAVKKVAKEKNVKLHPFLGQIDVTINSKAILDFDEIIDADPNAFREYKEKVTDILTFNKAAKLKVLKESKPFDKIIDDLCKWCEAIELELQNV